MTLPLGHFPIAKKWSPVQQNLSGLPVPVFGKMRIDLRDLQAQRRVHEHRRLVQTPIKQAVHLVDQFLGPAQGKGGDNLGSPEFGTILKLIKALGLKLHAQPA